MEFFHHVDQFLGNARKVLEKKYGNGKSKRKLSSYKILLSKTVRSLDKGLEYVQAFEEEALSTIQNRALRGIVRMECKKMYTEINRLKIRIQKRLKKINEKIARGQRLTSLSK